MKRFRIGNTGSGMNAAFGGWGQFLIPVERNDDAEVPRDGYPPEHWKPPV